MTISIRDADVDDIPAIFEVRTSVRENYLSVGLYLAMRHPETLGIPEEWHRVSQVIQIILGFAFALALGSPALYLDQVIAALMQVRPK
jgi:hypothetical protein